MTEISQYEEEDITGDNVFDLSNICRGWSYIIGTSQLSSTKISMVEEYRKFKGHVEIYPPRELVFNAFTFFTIENTKVVIVGQDCYHREGQAMGLCFSVPKGIKIPPSLKNIYKEIGIDPEHGDLTKWAEQGVLLLNAALTVREGSPGSHIKYWRVTDVIIQNLSFYCKNLVFVLWGNFAKNKEKYISKERGHLILKAKHPSPLSANRGGWFGNNHFDKINEHLLSIDKEPIDWNV